MQSINILLLGWRLRNTSGHTVPYILADIFIFDTLIIKDSIVILQTTEQKWRRNTHPERNIQTMFKKTPKVFCWNELEWHV